MDNQKCEEIIFKRFQKRNARRNRHDKVANAALKERILASKTISGDTVAASLKYATTKIPFVTFGWHFVYSRSGAEYVVLLYSEQQSDKQSLINGLFDLDDDVHTGGISLENSSASNYIVWKVTGTGPEPWGEYARMLMLSPGAFVYAVNHGRKGFDDSKFNAAIDKDFSFVSQLPAGSGKLSDYLDPNTPDLVLYWNTVDGYVFQSKDGICPPRKAGPFTIRGRNCEEIAAAARDVYGEVKPFSVVSAIRNHGFKDGIVVADVSISIKGGDPADWMATAVYVAEHSLVSDANVAKVLAIVPNPWADFPPLMPKELAEVYYDPDNRVWRTKWTVVASDHAATVADIEYYILEGRLLDPKITDPDAQDRKAEAAARKIVIKKFNLPKNWTSKVDQLGYFGLDGQYHDREHIHLNVPKTGLRAPMAELKRCLTENVNGRGFFQGCMPPDNRGP